MTNDSLMKLKVLQNAGAFCNTFDLHYVIIGLENQFVVFLRVAVLHRFYCVKKNHLNTSSEVSRRSRGLNFGLSLHIHPYVVYTSSYGSVEPAEMQQLT